MKYLLLFILLGTQITRASESFRAGEQCGEQLLKISNTQKNIEEARDAFVTCLSLYIQLRTISPVGNEQLAAEFFSAAIKPLGWPMKTYTTPSRVRGQQGSDRYNFIATLPAQFKRGQDFHWDQLPDRSSIILTHHADVVDVIPEQWESPELPFSGIISGSKSQPQEKFLWGRGALDMKGIGILQLVSMVMLEKLGWERKKDLHFLMLADEEEGSSGAIGTVNLMGPDQELSALSKAVLLLNESGGASMNLPKDGVNLHLIGVEEKGAAWLELTESNPLRLLLNMSKLRTIELYDLVKKDHGQYQRNCALESVVTPNSKVNVIASKVILKLSCDDDASYEHFKSAFTDGLEGVIFEYNQLKQRHTITLSTESSSHGSVGLSQSVLEIMALGFHRLGLFELPKKAPKKPHFFRETQTDSIKVFLKNLGSVNVPISLLRKLQWIPFMRRFMLQQVGNAFEIDGLFRTTCQFSALNFDGAKAKALVDCRLLHTAKQSDAKSFIHELKNFLANDQLEIQPIILWNVNNSPLETQEYQTIVASLKKLDPNALVTPYLFPAGTDNKFFRDPKAAGAPHIMPIPSYGFFPVFLTAELVATMHGSDERFPLKEVTPGLFKYLHVLKDLVKVP